MRSAECELPAYHLHIRQFRTPPFNTCPSSDFANLIVLSGPSGVGKSTVLRSLRSAIPTACG